MTLCRSVPPEITVSDVFGTRNAVASNLIAALLALPLSGKAVTAMRKTDPPAPSAATPCILLCAALGVTFTASKSAPLRSINGVGSAATDLDIRRQSDENALSKENSQQKDDR